MCDRARRRLGLVTEATSLRRFAHGELRCRAGWPRSCYRGNFVEAKWMSWRASLFSSPRSCYRGNFVEAHIRNMLGCGCFPQGCVNSDGDDLNQIVQTNEIIRISCDQRQFLSHGNRCDQQVGKALARLTSVASDSGEDLSLGTSRRDSEGYGLECFRDSLEPILPTSPPAQPAAVPYWPVDTGCARALR